MQLVETASKFNAQVRVHHNDRTADGRSPMELLMLIATQGSKLRLTADGDDADAALRALAQLIESGFGEALFFESTGNLN